MEKSGAPSSGPPANPITPQSGPPGSAKTFTASPAGQPAIAGRVIKTAVRRIKDYWQQAIPSGFKFGTASSDDKKSSDQSAAGSGFQFGGASAFGATNNTSGGVFTFGAGAAPSHGPPSFLFGATGGGFQFGGVFTSGVGGAPSPGPPGKPPIAPQSGPAFKIGSAKTFTASPAGQPAIAGRVIKTAVRRIKDYGKQAAEASPSTGAEEPPRAPAGPLSPEQHSQQQSLPVFAAAPHQPRDEGHAGSVVLIVLLTLALAALIFCRVYLANEYKFDDEL